jgi:hypothetical protein
VPPSLVDAWQRIEWANSDGKAVEMLIDTFHATDPYTIHIQPDNDRWKATFERTIDPAAEAVELTKIARSLGSFLDNTMAALNYLTYQLALLAIAEDPSLDGVLKPERVEFPIFRDRGLYRDYNRIEKLPDKYRLPIEDVQPYNGGHDGLWMLHELSRKYRHRLIHPIAVWAPAEFQGIDGVEDLEVVYRTKPLEHGDVILTFALGSREDVNPKVAIAVGIDHPGCADRGAAGILQEIVDEVGPILAHFEVEVFA